MSDIVNKVAQSGLITFDLETLVDSSTNDAIDLKDQLWQGMALKEKDFREFIKSNDWSVYEGKHVAVYCSADAIIPAWAYMLVASKLLGISASALVGTPEDLAAERFRRTIEALDTSVYEGARVMVKGCSDDFVPETAYVDLQNKLQPVVASIMFGEPCGAVPVWKKPRKRD
jgi:hypothetical protein